MAYPRAVRRKECPHVPGRVSETPLRSLRSAVIHIGDGVVCIRAGRKSGRCRSRRCDPPCITTQDKAPPEADPLKRPLTDKQKKQNSKSLKIELSKTYKKWLDEDVRWIITDEEQKAFKLLSNDEERDQFIEAFWQRRDPTPGHHRKRIQGRALPAHGLRQRAFRRRHPRLEERSRPNLYYVRPGGRD